MERAMAEPSLRIRSWVRASDQDIRTGLLGFLSVFIGPLVLDGITLRRTASGRLTLSFPARTDRAGRKHSYFRPADDAARVAIEAAIFEALGIGAEEGQHDGR
ncbi:MAG: hypothetical protein IPM29_32620 [Planctomycetes bacterium]|nr:hypothetical protein [Planctomycetota bacterium]